MESAEWLKHLVMGNDNCGILEGWPKSKKTKLPVMQEHHSWAHLPSLVLHDIFKMLSFKDRLNASSVCRQWRQCLFHPSFWKDVKFLIDPMQMNRSQFFTMKLGHIVRNARIVFNSLSHQSVYELTILLQQLSTNYNLRRIIIEPSHCHVVLDQHLDVTNLLMRVLEQDRISLEQLSLGGTESFCNDSANVLKIMADLHPNHVTLLGLASVKDDPAEYAILDCDPILFQPFQKLQILSVDYDIVSDQFLESLRGASDLSRLIIHIHGIWPGHPETTSEAWSQFTEQHPLCELRLTFIHAVDVVLDMEETVLRPTMPLSHLKVFFCEDLNLNVLDLLSSWYSGTFKSIVWVDSQNQANNMELVQHVENTDAQIPNPLVMTSWLCRNLEEVTLIGYKLFEDDLVAISRLRNDTLKKLEISYEDITPSVYSFYNDSDMVLSEVSKTLGRSWAPLHIDELHPVFSDPTAGDSDEYILPKVIADLY